jgi:hypothetical protein
LRSDQTVSDLIAELLGACAWLLRLSRAAPAAAAYIIRAATPPADPMGARITVQSKSFIPEVSLRSKAG